MCPKGQWEKLTKSSWVRSMSPFDQKLLDIRMPHSSFQILEVSIEEGAFFMIFAYFPFSSISDISNSFIYLFIYLFCRIFLISHNIFGLGDSYVNASILLEQIIGFLLQQCNGNWGPPHHIDDPFSGSVISLVL